MKIQNNYCEPILSIVLVVFKLRFNVSISAVLQYISKGVPTILQQVMGGHTLPFKIGLESSFLICKLVFICRDRF